MNFKDMVTLQHNQQQLFQSVYIRAGFFSEENKDQISQMILDRHKKKEQKKMQQFKNQLALRKKSIDASKPEASERFGYSQREMQERAMIMNKALDIAL